MKNLFFILVCLFISAELCAQGDESGNNPETSLNTNQLETSESSDENADAETSEQAVEEYYPGYAEVFTRIGKERGWPPVTRDRFDAQNGPDGAFLIGDPEEVAAKILRHSEALGGISRFTFQMVNAGLSHEKLLHSIDLIGTRVAPLIR